MSRMKSDELNVIKETEVKKSDVEDIDSFFDDMYLTESEKAERKELAKNIFIVLSAILTIIKANQILSTEHDIDYYKTYTSSNLETLFENVFGANVYKAIAEKFASDFIDTTMDNIDKDYYTSDVRATVVAENQTNALYNDRLYQQAVQSGKKYKTWITKLDQKVRDTHKEIHGEIVAIDMPFIVGDSELMYPCDLSGSYKEICNCRCVVSYDFENTALENDDDSLNYNVRYQKQREHIYGTVEYNRRKNHNSKDFSYFVKETTLKEIEKIVNDNKDAEKIYSPASKYPISYVDIESPIGRVYNSDIGDFVETNRVKIVYSSKGVHVFPVKNW